VPQHSWLLNPSAGDGFELNIFYNADRVGQLDPQLLVAQSVGVLVGSPWYIAGKLPLRSAAFAHVSSMYITQRDQKIVAWIALAVGALLASGGVFGVWLQGRFYEGGFPTAATVGEVRAAFTWPTAFTTAGSFVVSAVILSSPLTASWPTSRRFGAFVAFALVVLVACTVCGHLAGSRVAGILN